MPTDDVFPDSLCQRCAACRHVDSGRSVFLMCTEPSVVARAGKYPRQPVRACDGWRPRAPDG